MHSCKNIIKDFFNRNHKPVKCDCILSSNKYKINLATKWSKHDKKLESIQNKNKCNDKCPHTSSKITIYSVVV